MTADLASLIDRDSPLPFYFQLSELLEQAVADGDLQPGDRFPSEPDLCRRYALSRTTIRQALSRLEQRGLVERRKGQGTFVIERGPRSWLLQSAEGFFQDEVERQGRSVTSDVLRTVVRGPLPMWAASALGLAGPEGATLARLRRVDGLVAMYVVNHLPPGLGEQVLPLDVTDESLYERIRNRAGLEAAGGRRIVEAVLAEERLAKFLEVSVGAPLLFIESVTWDSNLRPFDCYQSWLRTDRTRIDVLVTSSSAGQRFAPTESLAAGE